MQNTQEINCPVCGYIVNVENNLVNSLKDVERIQCPLCKLMFFSHNNYEKVKYDKEYNLEFFRGTDIRKAGLVAYELSEIMRERLKGNKILEVGTGNGLVSYLLKTMRYEIKALDIDKDLCDYLRDLTSVDVICSRFEDYKTDLRFDLIYASHVIEHVTNPIEFIKKAYELLENKGFLYIDTPNIKFQEKYGINWKHFNTRNKYEHCCLFHQKTFETIEAQTDFKIVFMHEHKQYESMQVILRKEKE